MRPPPHPYPLSTPVLGKDRIRAPSGQREKTPRRLLAGTESEGGRRPSGIAAGPHRGGRAPPHPTRAKLSTTKCCRETVWPFWLKV